MKKAEFLISEIYSIMGNVSEAISKLTTKNKIKLSSDIKSKKGKTIPKNSIVDIIKITKKGNAIYIDIESIDGEEQTLMYISSDPFIHKVIK